MQVRISDDGKKYEHAMEDIFDEINEVEASDFFLREGEGGGACVQIVCSVVVAAAATVKGEVIKERQFWIEEG